MWSYFYSFYLHPILCTSVWQIVLNIFITLGSTFSPSHCWPLQARARWLCRCDTFPWWDLWGCSKFHPPLRFHAANLLFWGGSIIADDRGPATALFFYSLPFGYLKINQIIIFLILAGAQISSGCCCGCRSSDRPRIFSRGFFVCCGLTAATIAWWSFIFTELCTRVGLCCYRR